MVSLDISEVNNTIICNFYFLCKSFLEYYGHDEDTGKSRHTTYCDRVGADGSQSLACLQGYSVHI